MCIILDSSTSTKSICVHVLRYSCLLSEVLIFWHHRFEWISFSSLNWEFWWCWCSFLNLRLYVRVGLSTNLLCNKINLTDKSFGLLKRENDNWFLVITANRALSIEVCGCMHSERNAIKVSHLLSYMYTWKFPIWTFRWQGWMRFRMMPSLQGVEWGISEENLLGNMLIRFPMYILYKHVSKPSNWHVIWQRASQFVCCYLYQCN